MDDTFSKPFAKALEDLVPVSLSGEDELEEFEELIGVWGSEMKLDLVRMMVVALDTKVFCDRLKMSLEDIEEWRATLMTLIFASGE